MIVFVEVPIRAFWQEIPDLQEVETQARAIQSLLLASQGIF